MVKEEGFKIGEFSNLHHRCTICPSAIQVKGTLLGQILDTTLKALGQVAYRLIIIASGS
jgi:hypothetical protein